MRLAVPVCVLALGLAAPAEAKDVVVYVCGEDLCRRCRARRLATAAADPRRATSSADRSSDVVSRRSARRCSRASARRDSRARAAARRLRTRAAADRPAPDVRSTSSRRRAQRRASTCPPLGARSSVPPGKPHERQLLRPQGGDQGRRAGIVGVLGVPPRVGQPRPPHGVDHRPGRGGRARADDLDADAVMALQRLAASDERAQEEVAERAVLEQERPQHLALDGEVAHRLRRDGREVDRLARHEAELSEEPGRPVAHDLVPRAVEDRRLALEDRDRTDTARRRPYNTAGRAARSSPRPPASPARRARRGGSSPPPADRRADRQQRRAAGSALMLDVASVRRPRAAPTGASDRYPSFSPDGRRGRSSSARARFARSAQAGAPPGAS